MADFVGPSVTKDTFVVDETALGVLTAQMGYPETDARVAL